MKSGIKSDFEAWLISQCTADGNKRYLTIESVPAYLWFEGETTESSDQFISLSIVPVDTVRAGVGTKHTSGYYRFDIFSKSPLFGDVAVDYLSSILDDLRVDNAELTNLDVVKTFQRGNKFEGSTHYETIADINFDSWSCVS